MIIIDHGFVAVNRLNRTATWNPYSWEPLSEDSAIEIKGPALGEEEDPLGAKQVWNNGHRWCFKHFLFSPLHGEDEPILTIIFFRWAVQPPTSCRWFGKLYPEAVLSYVLTVLMRVPSKGPTQRRG